MELIRSFIRKRAIKPYIKKLPDLLEKDYGKAKTYTPKQVRSTIERGGLPVVYAYFGIAMFSTQYDFDQYHQEIGENCDYDAMHCEIGNSYFNGNSDFGVAEISSASTDFSGGFDAGGFSGGDGGGGGE